MAELAAGSLSEARFKDYITGEPDLQPIVRLKREWPS
jgi:hypothetical protein